MDYITLAFETDIIECTTFETYKLMKLVLEVNVQ